jgi:L-cystine uptake protein TcyP (sodium:dicarboxylate symporter family)
MLLNGVWEFAHSPLYVDHSQGWGYVVWSRLHCTVGDVMILLSCFWITSLLSRSRHWLLRPKFALPLVLFITLGVTYTVFSEWFNTQIRESWEYTTRMPTLFGIGLSPVLQWIVIPPILIQLIRASNRKKIKA